MNIKCQLMLFMFVNMYIINVFVFVLQCLGGFMKRLVYNTPELKFDIELADNVTVVYGDGNVGKTCIYNKLMDAVNKKQISYNIFFINMQSLYNVPLLQEKHNENTLIIIDDFDVVRIKRPEIITWLNYSINQVLIFGRDLHDLRVDKHYLYRISRIGSVLLFKPMLSTRSC